MRNMLFQKHITKNRIQSASQRLERRARKFRYSIWQTDEGKIVRKQNKGKVNMKLV